MNALMSVDSQPLEDSQQEESKDPIPPGDSPAPTELDTPSIKGLVVDPTTMETLPAVLPEDFPIPSPPPATRSPCLSELDARILELQRFGCKWAWGAKPFHAVHSTYGE